VQNQHLKSAMIKGQPHITRGIFFTLMVACLPSFSQPSSPVRPFAPPLDIPLRLTSNYGEIREAHFHAGIDILADPGMKVYSVREGTISRIAVTLQGYGKALYVTHPDGYTSVYAHLSSFLPEVEKYVKDQQYRKRKYVVDLYPAAGKFPVKQGQVIALTGNTGYSFGPHLHFEMRDSNGDIPLNVLTLGFPVTDSRKPRITCLGIYSLDPQSRVDDSGIKKLIPLTGNNDDRITIPDPVRVWGKIGFGIETYDYLDGRENICSPLQVSLLVDDAPVSSFKLDRIPFEKTSYVNSHIDYAEKIFSGRKIQKLFLDPNNELGIYSGVINRGICRFTDSIIHPVVIRVEDAAGNQSSLYFRVISEHPARALEMALDSNRVATFYFDSLNVFETGDLKVVVPAKALFTPVEFRYKAEKAADTLFSALHRIHDEGTPLRGTYIISVRPVHLPNELSSKAVLVQIGRDNKITSMGGNFEKGSITARVGSFGTFAVAVDTVPPEIRPVSFVNKGRFTEDQSISFQIKDDLSGIGSYNGFIDGKWALFEYDLRNNLLFYTPDASRLSQNQEHTLELIIVDNRNNLRKFNGRFNF
jgi:murein DD-endopeptidase MepM/ murein hydrolase activator NlpD